MAKVKKTADLPLTDENFDLGEYARRYWTCLNQGKVDIKWPENRDEVPERLGIYMDFIRRFAPHWEEEFAQVDRALGWEPGTCAAAQYFGYGTDAPVAPEDDHECTSWAVEPCLTDGKTVIMHKNRDSSANRLSLMHRAVPGKYAWTAMGNNSCPFPNMGLNSAGLAVVMNNGSPAAVYNRDGFGTVMLARVLLEECGTAKEAVALLREMIKAGNYFHNKRGSIWFLTDAKGSYVVEQSARYFAYHPVGQGVEIRANHWMFPEMVARCKHTMEERIKNFNREHSVFHTLMVKGWQKRKRVTLSDCFAAARSRERMGTAIEICNNKTTSATTFVIDMEFPTELSTVWIACGPPRHTVFIPFPVGTKLEEMPDWMLDGRFSDAIFVRRERTGHDTLTAVCPALEKQLRKEYDKAHALARKALRKGDKAAAAKLLADAFAKNIKAVKDAPFDADIK